MKTQYITATLRNASRPAAKLAAWQSRPAPRRLREIRDYLAKPWHAGETIAQARKSLIDSQGPELSSPEAERPLLWLSGEQDPEVMESYAGRKWLDHRGWFADTFEDSTLEAYAVRLNRFPCLMFYAVKSESGLRVELSDWEEIDFSDYNASDAIATSAREVIRSNDSSTEREAEESREYYERDQTETLIESNRETLASLRDSIRRLAHELKSLCPSPLVSQYPAAAQAVRHSLKSLLAERRDLMAENSKLAASL